MMRYEAERRCSKQDNLRTSISVRARYCPRRTTLDSAAQSATGVAFCSHAILRNDVFEVPDSHADERFAHNPLVTGYPHVRFYAGAPLVTRDGYAFGTVCAIDHRPRELTTGQREALKSLIHLVIAELEHRRMM